MTDEQIDLYITFSITSILILCLAGLLVLIGWSLPRAVRTYRSYPPLTASNVFAKWQLIRTVLYAAKLLMFVVAMMAFFVLPDTDLRRLLILTLLLLVALTIAINVLTEPVAQREVERAIEKERADSTNLNERMNQLEEKQDRDLEISQETRDLIGDSVVEQGRVREALEEQQGRVRKDLEEERERRQGDDHT